MADAELSKLKSNVFKIYFFSFFQMFLVFIPIAVPYWQSKGLSLQQVFTLQGIFGAVLIVFDAPAGYIADLFGRRRTLIMGCAVIALGFQVLWLGQTYIHFIIFECVLGIGMSLQSGCDVAILYNSLEKMELQTRKASYLGHRITAQTAGEGVASLLGGFLAAYSLRWPILANAVTPIIPLLVATTLYEGKGQTLPRGSHLENFRQIGKALFGHSRLLTWVIISFVFYGFATYCAVWSLQPYWSALGLSISWFGYLWAINSFVVALFSRYASAIEVKLGSTAMVVAIGVLPVVGYLGMGLSGGLYGLLFTLAFPLCRGLNQVIFQDAINTRVPANIRATANSIGTLGMRTLFLIFGPILGAVLDKHGPNQAMILLGCVYFVGMFAVLIPLLRQRSHFQTS